MRFARGDAQRDVAGRSVHRGHGDDEADDTNEEWDGNMEEPFTNFVRVSAKRVNRQHI